MCHTFLLIHDSVLYRSELLRSTVFEFRAGRELSVASQRETNMSACCFCCVPRNNRTATDIRLSSEDIRDGTCGMPVLDVSHIDHWR